MGRYDEAFGLTSSHRVSTQLSVQGAMEWALSKSPAILGGHLAEWAWGAATKRFPEQVTRRGAEFVGAVGVVVIAYTLQVVVSKYQAASSSFADRVTDGMVGRIAPEITGLFKRFFTKDAANGRANASCCDGDRQSVQEIATLLSASPETTQQLAEQMIGVMERDGVQFNDDGRRAVVRSMREVTSNMARGQF